MPDRSQYTRLEQLPNIGPAMARDFKLLGISSPKDLLDKDPYQLYDKLCKKTGVRHDPCVLDTFIAAVRFMQGDPKRPWWFYTKARKMTLGKNKSKTSN